MLVLHLYADSHPYAHTDKADLYQKIRQKLNNMGITGRNLGTNDFFAELIIHSYISNKALFH